MKIERLYSNYQEEERLYSTGNNDLDELLERAFCEGYEYAQREFTVSPERAKQFFKATGNRAAKKANKKQYILNTYGKEAKNSLVKDNESITPIKVLREARGISRTMNNAGIKSGDKIVNRNWNNYYNNVPELGSTVTSNDMRLAKDKFKGSRSEGGNSLFPYTYSHEISSIKKYFRNKKQLRNRGIV